MQPHFGHELMNAKRQDLDASVSRGRAARAVPRRSWTRAIRLPAMTTVALRLMPRLAGGRSTAPGAVETFEVGRHFDATAPCDPC
jgi:hypothetical protein